MSRSYMQDAFLKELSEMATATKKRISSQVSNIDLSEADKSQLNDVLTSELRGLIHGILVTLDGGSALADDGLISVVDEDGKSFDRNLHELITGYFND